MHLLLLGPEDFRLSITETTPLRKVKEDLLHIIEKYKRKKRVGEKKKKHVRMYEQDDDDDGDDDTYRSSINMYLSIYIPT